MTDKIEKNESSELTTKSDQFVGVDNIEPLIKVDKAVQTIKGAILRAQQKQKFLMLMWKNYENI